MNLLRELLGIIWGELLIIPMPWRAEIVIWIVILVGYHFLYRLSILLLLPEFWLTNRMRLWGLKPLPGTYAFGYIIELSVKIYRVLRWVMLLTSILGLVAWYSAPFLKDTTLVRYIHLAVDWWNALERRILGGS